MPYLNCPRCRLSIEQRRGGPELRFCPRCLSKLGEPTPLFRSTLPLRLLGDRGEDVMRDAPLDDIMPRPSTS